MCSVVLSKCILHCGINECEQFELLARRANSTSAALEVIHCTDEFKPSLILHRCKKATLCTGGFFDIKLVSIDDDGDAHNEFVTMGKQSIASDPDKIRRALLMSAQEEPCPPAPAATAPQLPAWADSAPAPFPAPAASSQPQTQTRITTLNTSG